MSINDDLAKAWGPLRYHDQHARGWRSQKRFIVASAGRRSGKTEVLAKRKLIADSIVDVRWPNGRTVLGAPTQDQAKDIFWTDLKKMIPEALTLEVRDSYPQTIVLKTGYSIELRGLDKPSRVEGKPLDRIGITETDDLKGMWVLDDHVLPALGTTGRPGKGIFEGVPNGKVILWELRKRALRDPKNWDYLEWPSSEVLLEEEIEFWRRTLDPKSYDREFNASFANFEGRAYYPFQYDIHAAEHLQYDPNLPLIFCFDFNVSPGIAVICQEQNYFGVRPYIAPRITAVLGEVWIDSNSNTEIVCRKLLEDWGTHKGIVYAYGDATGGAAGSAKVSGSDWDLIGGKRGHLSKHFGSRFRMKVQKSNPSVKARVNAVNRRLSSGDVSTGNGLACMLIDPARAPHVAEDFDGVTLIEGGAFEIDKKKCERANLTHVSDALGYYIHDAFPIQESSVSVYRA